MTETKLSRAIQEALCWIPGVVVWRCNTARRAKMAFGLRGLDNEVAGTPDLIGIVDGCFLGLEVKHPNNKKDPSPEQASRLQQIRDHGGIAAVVRSVDEAVAVVKDYQAFAKDCKCECGEC